MQNCNARPQRGVWLSVVLTLALLVGVMSPAGAHAQLPGTDAGVPGATVLAAGRPEVEAARANVSPLAEAYLLLVERYALPLDPTALVTAAQAGMAAALKDAGVEAATGDPARYGLGTVEAFAALQDDYETFAARYGSMVPARKLVYAAIEGMASSVGDAHTNFLTPEEYLEEQRWQRGEVTYGGIGVRITGPPATILEVFPGSPAERVGLLPGDAIVGVAGEATREQALDEVIKLVRGPDGTAVTLSVERAGSGRVDSLTLTRAQVASPVVSARRLPGDLGYVRLRSFADPAVVTQVEQAVLQQQRDGIRGLVLDLRGNSGGRISVGTRLLADFVSDGPIFQAVDRAGQRDVRSVSGGRLLVRVPLAVLVDGGTASMGEIFAAAIQERQAGRVIGETTAGAVAASRFIPLSDGSALQLSIEQVYSGDGAPLDRVGVRPDQEVALDLDALRQGRDTQLDDARRYLEAAGPPIRIGQPAAPAEPLDAAA